MFEDKELEEIRLRKIQAMLNQAEGSRRVSNHPITLTDDTFYSAVRANDLLIVDFWAPWCGPCRMVGPIIEQLAKEYGGKVTFGKMNVDENQIVPRTFRIMSIPTIVVFDHGKAVKTLVGACSKSHIEAAFKRYLKQ